MHSHFSYFKSNDTDSREKRFRFSEDLDRACEIEFGSYCLWSIERREFMKDAIVKRLKDQLFMARSYYPSIAKIQGKEALTRELKQCIQDHEKVLSESTVDGDLPSSYVLMFIYIFFCSFQFTEIRFLLSTDRRF
jgi:alpha-1,4-galacturonosyltransferase